MTDPEGSQALLDGQPLRGLRREPVIVISVLSALILEICVWLRSFGVPLTDGQRRSILTGASLLIPLAGALIARRQTTVLVDPRDNTGCALVAAAAEEEPSSDEGSHTDR